MEDKLPITNDLSRLEDIGFSQGVLEMLGKETDAARYYRAQSSLERVAANLRNEIEEGYETEAEVELRYKKAWRERMEELQETLDEVGAPRPGDDIAEEEYPENISFLPIHKRIKLMGELVDRMLFEAAKRAIEEVIHRLAIEELIHQLKGEQGQELSEDDIRRATQKVHIKPIVNNVKHDLGGSE